MVTENCYLRLRKISAELYVSPDSIRTILNDCLGMKRVAARLVPKDLNFLQKLNEYHRTTAIFSRYGSGRLFSFPKLKLLLRGTRFQSIEDIKENLRRELKSILENVFKKCFDDCILCWDKCIISRGAYFEGDKMNLDE